MRLPNHPDQITTLVDLFLAGAERDKLDPLLDTCVAVYQERLDKDERLSNIIKTFDHHFGTLFNDGDRVAQRIRDHTAPKVAADPADQNAKKDTPTRHGLNTTKR